MPTLSTISPLELFREIFPATRLFVYPDELKYRFHSEDAGRICERHANEIIIRNLLPLTADLYIWERGGVVFEICLVVKEVPEESIIVR